MYQSPDSCRPVPLAWKVPAPRPCVRGRKRSIYSGARISAAWQQLAPPSLSLYMNIHRDMRMAVKASGSAGHGGSWQPSAALGGLGEGREQSVVGAWREPGGSLASAFKDLPLYAWPREEYTQSRLKRDQVPAANSDAPVGGVCQRAARSRHVFPCVFLRGCILPVPLLSVWPLQLSSAHSAARRGMCVWKIC